MKTEHNVDTNELTNLLDTLWRRKWVVLIPFLVISPLVALFGLYLPNLYRSSVSIYVEPQKVPQEYVRSTVTTNMETRIRTIKQQLTSRTKLLKVINDLNLYSEDVQKQTLNEVLVSKMRDDLEIEVANQRDQNFFTVHYTHRDPTKAMLGVSRLVSLFIEESLRIREDQAVGTTRFLEEELESVKKKLEKQEALIQSFKKQHIGELPDQLDSNLRMLDNLNLQLQDNMESLREVESRVILIEQEISRFAGQIQFPSVAAGGSVTGGSNLLGLLQQRDALRQEISRLESIYTQRHPDLISAKNALAKTEDQIHTGQKNLNSQPKTSLVISPVRASAQFAPELNNLIRQLNVNKPRLAALLGEDKDIRARILMYQARVEAAPKREQQLLTLTRDYDNTRQNYQDLLNKKLEAQLSQNLEKRQEGERFRVLDPANLPEKPHRPNRIKIILLGIAGGLGLGVGLVFLLESLFPAFHSLKSLQSNLDIPIIMAIPEIVIQGERREKMIRLSLSTTAVAAVTVVVLILLDKFVLDLGRVAVQIGENIRSMRL